MSRLWSASRRRRKRRLPKSETAPWLRLPGTVSSLALARMQHPSASLISRIDRTPVLVLTHSRDRRPGDPRPPERTRRECAARARLRSHRRRRRRLRQRWRQGGRNGGQHRGAGPEGVAGRAIAAATRALSSLRAASTREPPARTPRRAAYLSTCPASRPAQASRPSTASTSSAAVKPRGARAQLGRRSTADLTIVAGAVYEATRSSTRSPVTHSDCARIAEDEASRGTVLRPPPLGRPRRLALPRASCWQGGASARDRTSATCRPDAGRAARIRPPPCLTLRWPG